MREATAGRHVVATLLAAKKAMRSAVLARRDALDAGERELAGLAITARIRALPKFEQAGCILLTLPFGSEWDTRPLALAALERGKSLVLPRVDAAARVLVLHRVADLADDIAAGFRGIPEPAPHTPVAVASDVDCALVPGVAFDARGGRLGYGGGYYDRLLPLLGPHVPRIAGAFDVQIVDDVPTGPHDHAVDLVVTPTRTFVGRR